MPLPVFQQQPNEMAEFQSAIVTFFRDENVNTYIINGLFDLLLSSPITRSDSYLELKVRLQTQRYMCPITAAQWRLFNGHDPASPFEANYRVLIYDQQNGGRYAMATASNLRNGITANEPNDTSYITVACLNALAWAEPKVISQYLLAWVHRQ